MIKHVSLPIKFFNLRYPFIKHVCVYPIEIVFNNDQCNGMNIE